MILRRAPGLQVVLWYVPTRIAALALLVFLEAPLFVDPLQWLTYLDALGPARAFPEYPWPAVALLHLPIRLGVPTYLHYFAAVVLFTLLVDALLTGLLWRIASRQMSNGVRLWLLAFPALGPLMVTRFDIIPASLIAAALLALHAARPTSAGALAALGCGLKLWPVLGVPALLVPGTWRARGLVLWGLLIGGLVLALATAAAAGADRLWSPLSAQLQRGLQFEAFAALPLMWLRSLDPGAAPTLQLAAGCNCHELFGTGVAAALRASTLAGLVGAIGVVGLYLRAIAAPQPARTVAVAALLATVAVMVSIMSSRVFSPQYMIWLAALLAALGALPGQNLARTDVGLFLAACVLTQMVYPLGFQALLIEGHYLQRAVLVLLTLRDALLVALGARLCVQHWRATAPGVEPARTADA
jgi:hypothetical protein